MTESGWTLFTVRKCFDARRIHTQSDQVIFCSVRTTLTKGKVVLTCAALISMAFDDDTNATKSFDPSCLLFKGRTSLSAQLLAIERKENTIANIHNEIFL